MSASRNAARAAEIWRRHQLTDRDLRGRIFWKNMTLEQGTIVAWIVFFVLQVPLESPLWRDTPPGYVSRDLLGRFALGLLVLAPVSGVLLERYLARWAPPGMVPRPRARLAFGVLGSLPLAGFFLIPLARRLIESRSPWILRPPEARLNLEAPPAPLPRGWRWQRVYTSGIFAFWQVVPGFLLLLAGSLWLAEGEDNLTTLAATVALHLAQAGSLALYARSDLRFTHLPRRRLRLAAWLCLLPQPASLAALLLVLWPEVEGPRNKTLTWSVYARTSSVRRGSRWLDLRLELQQQWTAGSWIERWTRLRGLEISRPKGRAEAAKKTWMRIKSFLLAIETALAAGLLTRGFGAGPVTGYDPLRDSSLRSWLAAVGLLAVLGLLQAALGAVCLLLRVSPLPKVLDPPAAGLYLFITQAALAFGLLMGSLAAHEELRVLAALSAYTGALAALLALLLAAFMGFGSGIASSESFSTVLTWLAVLTGLGLLPLAVFKWPELAWAGVGLVMLAPAVDVWIGVRSLRWILHPFGWRDLFERQLPVRVRVRLGLLALMAILPLGGIAVPAWLWKFRGRPLPGRI